MLSIVRLARLVLCVAAGLGLASCASLPGTGLAGLLPQEAAHGLPTAVAVIVDHGTAQEFKGAGASHYAQQRPDLADSFADCLATALVSSQPGDPIKVIHQSQFDAVAFPGVDARTAPRSTEVLGLLLDNADFQSRLADAEIRYLAVISGGTRVSDPQDGNEVCHQESVLRNDSWSKGEESCYTPTYWATESRLSAWVVDLPARRQALSATVIANDREKLSSARPPPLGDPRSVEALNCPRIGAALAVTLRGLVAQPY